MKTAYETSSYSHTVREIEIDRQTEHFVFNGKDRYKKNTAYSQIFDTEKEAVAHILTLAETRKLRILRELDSVNKDIKRLREHAKQL